MRHSVNARTGTGAMIVSSSAYSSARWSTHTERCLHEAVHACVAPILPGLAADHDHCNMIFEQLQHNPCSLPMTTTFGRAHEIHNGIRATKMEWLRSSSAIAECYKPVPAGLSQHAGRVIGTWNMHRFRSSEEREIIEHRMLCSWLHLNWFLIGFLVQWFWLWNTVRTVQRQMKCIAMLRLRCLCRWSSSCTHSTVFRMTCLACLVQTDERKSTDDKSSVSSSVFKPWTLWCCISLHVWCLVAI